MKNSFSGIFNIQIRSKGKKETAKFIRTKNGEYLIGVK